ncbi:hypothetical protein D3C72_1927640 [compost metagenome]
MLENIANAKVNLKTIIDLVAEPNCTNRVTTMTKKISIVVIDRVACHFLPYSSQFQCNSVTMLTVRYFLTRASSYLQPCYQFFAVDFSISR